MKLDELYDLFDRLRPFRRRAAAAMLRNELGRGASFPIGSCETCRATLHELESASSLLASLPGSGTQRELLVDGRHATLNLDYEITELERDVTCLRDGPAAVSRLLWAPESSGEQIDGMLELFGDTAYAAAFSDRDGTITNYCGRYRSSHQPLYAAVEIARFARDRCDEFFVVTSGPLYGHGLLSLSSFPDETVHLAGSKGREFKLADGKTGSYPLSDEQRAAIIRLDHDVQELLDRPEYRLLSAIGSGYQRKFGQLTVSRQDVHRSVPEDLSGAFLHDVRRLVGRVDPEHTRFEIDDTGFDVEITLVAEGDRRRGFDKGDGVRFLVDSLALDLRGVPVLVCGDTPGDVPMLESLAEAGARTHAVFATEDEALRRVVRERATASAFCSGPDVLVAALGSAADRGGTK
ncbi:MAG: hypothetical protein ACOC0O_01895 [Spirochaetota bacterium]